MSHEHPASTQVHRAIEEMPQRNTNRNVDFILEADNVIQRIKAQGKDPVGIFDLPTVIQISPEMTSEERLKVISENQAILHSTLTDGRLEKNNIKPQLKYAKVYEWTMEGDEAYRLRTVLTRVTHDLTLADSIYLDNEGTPYFIRAQLWASREMMNDFQKEHRQDKA